MCTDQGELVTDEAPWGDPPSRQVLWTGLIAALDPPPAVVRRRRACDYQSTFGTEIVRVELADGRRQTLFCKYGPGYIADNGHARGVSYEADVYAHVIDRLDVSTPRFDGAWLNAADGRTLLVLGYLPRAAAIHHSTDPDVLARAAAVLARFHRSSGYASEQTTPNRFDEAFYRRWTERLPALAAGVEGPRWLAELCDGCVRVADRLSDSVAVVVHGELFTSNALVHRRQIYFIDWETAATGAAELDLAALTIGRWSPSCVSAAERAYIDARFGDRPPTGFADTLAAARVYVLLELLSSWLEDAPERLPTSSESWVFDQLRQAGTRLGVL
jgi:hypothetical protein